VLTPYPFQQEAIDRIAHAPGFILSDACGLGKTLTVIEAVKKTRPSGFKALVVVPPSLLLQWSETLLFQDDRAIQSLQGRPYDFSDWSGWALTTQYELQYDYVQKALQNVLWDFIIVDEAHRMKNPKTGFFSVMKNLPKVRGISLTATPMETGEENLWALLHFADPDMFPAYWGFVMKNLIVEKGYYQQFIIKGPKNPSAFAEMIEPYFLRRTKEDVLPQLPEKIVIDVPIAMTEKQQRVYDRFRTSKDILVELDGNEFIIENALTMLTRLQQIASDPTLIGIEGTGSGKLDWLDDFITDHPGEPTVIFSRFKDWLPPLCQKYKGVLVAGIQDSSEYFKAGQVDYLFGTIDKMGEGLNLQRAKHAIFLDGHWSATKMTQAIDRVHRMNIKESKNIYFLKSCREDAAIYTAVDKKWTEHEFLYYYLREAQNDF